MNKFKLSYIYILLFSLAMASCGEDEMPAPVIDPPSVVIGMNQTVDILSTVMLDASAMGQGQLTYNWTITDPNGMLVSSASSMTETIEFITTVEGNYSVEVAVTNVGGTTTESGTVSVRNESFSTDDQMGRPAINTVFNFFGDAATKNGYNATMPADGNVDSELFKGILDALQGYIGLDASSYTNVLGLDNATTASVLATDVLMSNKDFSSTYGPSDLTDLRLGENLLNGRGLNDDVVDVTLILTFGADLANLSDLQTGLLGDRVPANDKEFSNQFPYLASPH